MNRREFLAESSVLGLGLGALLSYISDAEPAGWSVRPNIIVILIDNMGFSDISCCRSEIPTPNIDRLAENGLLFTQFYHAGRYCPIRASLLTGFYPHQTGHVIDIMPMLVEVSNARYPKEIDGRQILPMEGRSLIRAFSNKPTQRDAIYWEHEANAAIHKGDWKLVRRGFNEAWEL